MEGKTVHKWCGCCVCRVSGIVGTIHASWSGTRVIVMGILPRGTDYWDGGSASRNWPNVLTPAINALNNALQVCNDPDKFPSLPGVHACT